MDLRKYYPVGLFTIALLLFFRRSARTICGHRRKKIPVLTTAEEIARLRGGSEKSYLLVKERARRQLPAIAPESITARGALGSTTWYLVEMGM